MPRLQQLSPARVLSITLDEILSAESAVPGAEVSMEVFKRLGESRDLTVRHPSVPLAVAHLRSAIQDRETRRSTAMASVDHFVTLTIQAALVSMLDCTSEILTLVVDGGPTVDVRKAIAQHPNATRSVLRALAFLEPKVRWYRLGMYLARHPAARTDMEIMERALRGLGALCERNDVGERPLAPGRVREILAEMAHHLPFAGDDGLLAAAVRSAPSLVPELWESVTEAERQAIGGSDVASLLSIARGPLRDWVIVRVVPRVR